MLKITLPRKMIAAALEVAPKDDVRYYLNGVYIELKGNYLHAVATDGYVLFAVRRHIEHADLELSSSEPFHVILSYPAATYAAKGPTKQRVQLWIDTERKESAIGGKDGLQSFPLVDGRYPDWRRVIPSQVQDTRRQYSPAKLAQVHRAFMLLRGRSRHHDPAGAEPLHVYDNAETDQGGAVMYDPNESDAIGLVMPFRYFSAAERVSAIADAIKQNREG